MKIGLIGRCDQRGIAYQTREFWEHMGHPRTLAVMMEDPAWPEDPSVFGDDVVIVKSNLSTDLTQRSLDERRVRRFLEGLDVVFAVETVYDWRFVDWARDMRVKVVVQGNPEFYAHHLHPHWSQPNAWWWPTPWLTDELPDGEIVPVPAPISPVEAADPDDDTLHVLHVIGKQAAGDRNGSFEFMEAVAGFRGDIHVRIVTQGDRLPRTNLFERSNIELEVITGGVEDRWSMYDGMHLMVLPRKYGGLCLPAIEAMSSGLAVAMPSCSPNEIWPGPRLTARKGRIQRSPFGRIQTYGTHPNDISSLVNCLAGDREKLAQHMAEAAQWADWNRWDDLREQIYLPALERVPA